MRDGDAKGALLGIWHSELGTLGQAGRFLLILAVGPTLARLLAGRMQEQATP